MLTFGDNITVYSAWKRGRDVRWLRTQVHRVSWYGKQAATIGSNGLVTADQYTVRVPLRSLTGYIPPDQWRALGAPQAGTWTARTGDVIVKGLVDDEVQNDVTEITKKYTDCFVVTGLYDNRRISLKHLRIEGK